MATIDLRALTPLTTTKRCPSCRASNVGWFGMLRVCAACGYVFHWRDALSES
jgi:transposase